MMRAFLTLMVNLSDVLKILHLPMTHHHERELRHLVTYFRQHSFWRSSSFERLTFCLRFFTALYARTQTPFVPILISIVLSYATAKGHVRNFLNGGVMPTADHYMRVLSRMNENGLANCTGLTNYMAIQFTIAPIDDYLADLFLQNPQISNLNHVINVRQLNFLRQFPALMIFPRGDIEQCMKLLLDAKAQSLTFSPFILNHRILLPILMNILQLFNITRPR